MRKVSHISYAIFWSFIIGIVTASYLNLVNWVIHLVWGSYSSFNSQLKMIYPFIICISAGLLIGFLSKKLGNYPLTIEEILTSARKNGKINYHNWWKSLTLGLLVLGAGASVGPEASTSVITASMINWLGDRLRWAKSSGKNIWFDRTDKDELENSDRFSDLFSTKGLKKIVIFLLILVGVLGAALVFKLFPEEGVFGIHFRPITWQWASLLSAAPALIVGVAFGWFFVHLENWFVRIVNIRGGKVLQAVIFGVFLAAMSLISVDFLFSGEFRIVPFSQTIYDASLLSLVVIAFVKAITTNLGFVMGWRGGTIFPAIFCSIAIGGFIARLLPGDPRITVAVVLTASLMMILRNLSITVILILLLISIYLTPVVLLVALLIAVLQKKKII